MGEVEYTNLRLSFKQRSERDYEVTASIDGGATATSVFTIPMTDEALQEAIRSLSATRSALTEATTRKITPVTEHGVTAQEFGTKLADALITGDVATMFDEARGKGAVRVRLNMTTEPELLRIPWEFLRRNGKDLASRRDCTIVRELVTAEPARPYLVEGKIRMLGVIANPRRDLDVEGEKRRVTESLEKCKDQVELEWLEDCTFKTLQRKLQDTYHILHFVGHSAFTAEGESIVLLNDENGMPKEQSADSISQLIGRQESLQLVVFNSCDGARTKLDDPFASIATMLVQQGQSAVIAMQFEITDPAAKAFAEELYYCLIDRRYAIDAAVAEARIAMLDVNQIEFATPVLFLRPGFVDLFNFKAPPDPAPPAVGPPPSPPVDAPPAVGPPPSPPAKASKRTRWLVAGGGVAAVVVAVVAIVALSSGDDKADVPVTAVPTTISKESFLTIQDCIESNLFLRPYFDASSPESYVGIGQCDEARKQLEADGLDADPIYAPIVDRLVEAGSLGSMVDGGTDTPADHQAFADNGEGLYQQVRPMLRALKGLDPSGGFSFANAFGGEVADGAVDTIPETPLISGYQSLTDDTGALTVDVPIEWTDTDTAPFTFDDGTEQPHITASPSIAEAQAGYTAPGLFFTLIEPAVPSLDDLLATFATTAPPGECTDAGIEDYADDAYTGRFQTFTDCGGTGAWFVMVAAVPSDNSFTAIVTMTLVSDTDLAVLDRVLATFDVTS